MRQTGTGKTVAVLLSGCGVYDGSEIHESVLTLLALDRHGCTIPMFCTGHSTASCDQS